MEITRKSALTSIVRTREIDVTADQLFRCEHRGELAQHVFWNLSPDDREFIINGITSEEWEGFSNDLESDTY
mgnify:CR=1 FL=1